MGNQEDVEGYIKDWWEEIDLPDPEDLLHISGAEYALSRGAV